MSTKNLLSNLKNNHRLIIIVILLIVLVVLAHRYQREHFQEVNINSLAKAGSKGSAGSPGKAGDSALNILQKLEAPSDADEKALYDAVFQHGSNTTPEGDSAVNILKGLVDHITAKVTENMGSGVPAYTVIIHHLTRSQLENIQTATKYLDHGVGSIVGGEDSDDIVDGGVLPAGFQVCNGADLMKYNSEGTLVKDGDKKTPNYKGRFLLGIGNTKDNNVNTWEHDGGAATGYATASNQGNHFYQQHFSGGAQKTTLGDVHMPCHRHDIPAHKHDIPDHKHDMPNHTHDIPAHKHKSLMRSPGKCNFADTSSDPSARAWEKCPKFGNKTTDPDSYPENYENIMVRGWIEETIATASRPNLRVAKGYYSDTNSSLGYATYMDTKDGGAGKTEVQNGGHTNLKSGLKTSDGGAGNTSYYGGTACKAQPHNNMPPYKAVLYLIKIKDER